MCGAHLSCACVPPASVHAAHPTHFWHINREHVSGVWVEINVLKFKKTATLNIHSMFLFPFLLLELTEKLVAQDMQKQRKNRDTTWLRWTARYPNRMQPNGTCFFFFLTFLSAFRTKASHETSKTEDWTRLPVQKSDIIYKASHVASSQQVLFRLDVFCFQQRKYISF